MTALVGGEVEGNVSAIIGFLGLRTQADEAGGEDLADLGKPLGGGHQVGVEGVGEVAAKRLGHDREVSTRPHWRGTFKPSNPPAPHAVKRFTLAFGAC